MGVSAGLALLEKEPGTGPTGTGISERPSLQAAFPKTVLKTFSRNGLISMELWEQRARSLGDAKHTIADTR